MVGPVLQRQGSAPDPDDPQSRVEPDAAAAEHPLKLGSDPLIVGGKDGPGLEEKMELRRPEGPARFPAQCLQRMADRQQELDAAGSGSDHSDAGSSGSGQDALPDLGPAAEKVADRLDRNHRFGSSWNRVKSGRGADVDGDQVVGNGRPGTAQNPFGIQVQADGLIMEEAGARKLGERPQVDVRLVVFVVTGDQARKHTGVRSVDVPGDEGQANTRHGLCAEALQDSHVAVTAADQNQILGDGNLNRVHDSSGAGGGQPKPIPDRRQPSVPQGEDRRPLSSRVDFPCPGDFYAGFTCYKVLWRGSDRPRDRR